MTTTVTLADVVHAYSELSAEGIGHHHRWPAGHFEAERRTLVDCYSHLFPRVVLWLAEATPPVKVPKVSSYHLKHVCERAIDHYVPNGLLIAAALAIGLPRRADWRTVPNVALAISRRWLKQQDHP